LVLAATFVVLATSLALAQAKPERQSKAVKPSQKTEVAKPSAPDEGDAQTSETPKPEEKAFKGMKYRMIGPFRGGR